MILVYINELHTKCNESCLFCFKHFHRPPHSSIKSEDLSLLSLLKALRKGYFLSMSPLNMATKLATA